MRCRSVSACRSAIFSFAHVLIGKPVPTFPGHALRAQKKNALLRVLRPAQRAKAPHARVFRPESGGREGERAGTGSAVNRRLCTSGHLPPKGPQATLSRREKPISHNNIAAVGEDGMGNARALALAVKCVLAGTLVAILAPAYAQAPALDSGRTITLVVPIAAGGGMD